MSENWPHTAFEPAWGENISFRTSSDAFIADLLFRGCVNEQAIDAFLRVLKHPEFSASQVSFTTHHDILLQTGRYRQARAAQRSLPKVTTTDLKLPMDVLELVLDTLRRPWDYGDGGDGTTIKNLSLVHRLWTGPCQRRLNKVDFSVHPKSFQSFVSSAPQDSWPKEVKIHDLDRTQLAIAFKRIPCVEELSLVWWSETPYNFLPPLRSLQALRSLTVCAGVTFFLTGAFSALGRELVNLPNIRQLTIVGDQVLRRLLTSDYNLAERYRRGFTDEFLCVDDPGQLSALKPGGVNLKELHIDGFCMSLEAAPFNIVPRTLSTIISSLNLRTLHLSTCFLVRLMYPGTPEENAALFSALLSNAPSLESFSLDPCGRGDGKQKPYCAPDFPPEIFDVLSKCLHIKDVKLTKVRFDLSLFTASVLPNALNVALIQPFGVADWIGWDHDLAHAIDLLPESARLSTVKIRMESDPRDHRDHRSEPLPLVLKACESRNIAADIDIS